MKLEVYDINGNTVSCGEDQVEKKSIPSIDQISFSSRWIRLDGNLKYLWEHSVNIEGDL